jgi:hypothetical protein
LLAYFNTLKKAKPTEIKSMAEMLNVPTAVTKDLETYLTAKGKIVSSIEEYRIK